MAEQQNGDTGATPTPGSIEEAAAKMAARRQQPSEPTKVDTREDVADGADVDDGSDAEHEDGDNQQDATGNADTADGEEGDESDASSGDADGAGEGTDGADASEGSGDKRLSLNSLPKAELDRKVTILVDGEVVETTVREALRGHMRQEAFSRRTAEVQQHKNNLLSAREQFLEVSQQLEGMMTDEMVPGYRTDAEWQQLLEEDPNEHYIQRQKFLQAQQAQKDKLAALKGAREKQAKDKQQEQAKQYHDHLVGQMQELCKLVGIKPEDTKSRQEFVTRNVAYLKRHNVDDAMIGSISDARAFVFIDKARKYDEIMAKKQQANRENAVQGNRPVVRPNGGDGKPRPTSAQVAVSKAQEQLKKTGSEQDAAKAIAAKRAAAEAAQRKQGRR